MTGEEMGAGRSNGLRVVPESWAKLSKVEQSWAKSSNVKQCQAMSSNVKQSQFQLFPLLPKNLILSTHFITKCWSVFFVCKSLDTTERMPLSLLNAYTTNYCSAVQDLS